MNKVEKKSLIKSLLSGRLTKKQRKEFADLEPIDIEIRKQWNESGNRLVDVEIKEQIWKSFVRLCNCFCRQKYGHYPINFLCAKEIGGIFPIW